MALQFVMSTRNVKKLIDNGYLFINERCSDDKIIWKCDQAYKSRCHARLHTFEDEIIKRIGIHNHATSSARVQVSKVINEATNKAVETLEQFQCITTDALCGLPQPVIGQIPQIGRVDRRILKVINVPCFLVRYTASTHTAERHLTDNLAAVSSKYKNIVSYDHPEASPTMEKNTFKQF